VQCQQGKDLTPVREIGRMAKIGQSTGVNWRKKYAGGVAG